MLLQVNRMPEHPDECPFFTPESSTCLFSNKLCDYLKCPYLSTEKPDNCMVLSNKSLADVRKLSRISDYLLELHVTPMNIAYTRLCDALMFYIQKSYPALPVFDIVQMVAETHDMTFESMRGFLKNAVHDIFDNLDSDTLMGIYGYVPSHRPSFSEFLNMSRAYFLQSDILNILYPVESLS